MHTGLYPAKCWSALSVAPKFPYSGWLSLTPPVLPLTPPRPQSRVPLESSTLRHLPACLWLSLLEWNDLRVSAVLCVSPQRLLVESCSSLLYRHLHQKRKSRGNSGDNLKSFLCFKTIALSSTEKEGRISLKFKGYVHCAYLWSVSFLFLYLLQTNAGHCFIKMNESSLVALPVFFVPWRNPLWKSKEVSDWHDIILMSL